jgi:hypothetical protein
LIIDGREGPTWSRWQGEREQGHAALIKLAAKGPNAAALGSRVILSAGGQQQIREVGLSSGLPNGPPGYLHFGLGTEIRVQNVDVCWPDGTRQSFPDLPVDQLVVLKQGGPALWGDSLAASSTDPGAVAGGQTEPSDDPSGGQQPETSLAEPRQTIIPPRLLELYIQSKGGPITIASRAQSPMLTLLLFRDPDCTSCRSICQQIANVVQKKPDVKALVIILGPRKGDRKCPLPQHQAADTTIRAMAAGRALLPLTALVDSQGVTRRLISGSLEGTNLSDLVESYK